MKMGNKRKAESSPVGKPKKLKAATNLKSDIIGNDFHLISKKFKSMIKTLDKVSKTKDIREDILDQSLEMHILETMEENVPVFNESVNKGNDVTSDINIKDENVDNMVVDVFKTNERDLLENEFREDLKKMEKIVKESFQKKDKIILKEQKKNKQFESSLKEHEKLKKDLKKTIEVLDLVQKKNVDLEEAVVAKNKIIEKLIITNKEIENEHKSITTVFDNLNDQKIVKTKKIKFRLLLETRSKFFSNIRISIEQLIEQNLYHLLKSAEGSVFFQENFHLATDDEKEILLKVVVSDPVKMANNKLGSFMMQDLVSVFTENQTRELFKKMAPTIKGVILNKYGCRFLQNVFGSLPVDIQDVIITVLSKDVIDYSKNSCSSFVLQKCIELGDVNSSLELKRIILKINLEAHSLCMDKFGSRVIQPILSSSNEEFKNSMKSSVYEILPVIIDHKYGNYIAQKLFEFGDDSDRKKVVSCCSGKVLEMAESKHASNVIQLILKAGSVDDKIMVIKEVSGKNELDILTKNQYGNYVVQEIIENAEVCFLREIHDKIINIVEVDNAITVEKLRMKVQEKIRNKNIVRLAKRFVNDAQDCGRLREKFKNYAKEIDRWMEDILSYEKMNLETLKIPLFIEVLEDLNDQEENYDLAELRLSLRVYLKELVAYQGKVQFGLIPIQGHPTHQNQDIEVVTRSGSSGTLHHNYQVSGGQQTQHGNHHQQPTFPHQSTNQFNQLHQNNPQTPINQHHILPPHPPHPHSGYPTRIQYQNHPNSFQPTQQPGHGQVVNTQQYLNMNTMPHNTVQHSVPMHHQANLPVHIQQHPSHHPPPLHQVSHDQTPPQHSYQNLPVYIQQHQNHQHPPHQHHQVQVMTPSFRH